MEHNELIVTVLNSLMLVGNLLWQWIYRRRGTEIQVLQDVTEQSKAKDEVIRDLKRERDHYKREHTVMVAEYQKLQAEVQAYRQKKGTI